MIAITQIHLNRSGCTQWAGGKRYHLVCIGLDLPGQVPAIRVWGNVSGLAFPS